MATRKKNSTQTSTLAPAVVLDGNQQVVTDERTKQALVRREKKVAKQLKSARETGVSKVTAQAVLKIFDLAKSGTSNSEIAGVIGISPSYIGPILSGHPNWVKHTADGFTVLGRPYPEKFVRPKQAST